MKRGSAGRRPPPGWSKPSVLLSSRELARGQRDPERGARARRALQPEAPAVQLDQGARDRQAQAAALPIARRLRLRAVIALEDTLPVGQGDAGPVVRHGQDYF